MRILMLNPPFTPKFSRTSRSPATTRGGTIYYPIWLAYATGVLDEEGFDVRLIDAPARGYSHKDVLKIAERFKPDLTVVDTSTPSIFNDVNVAASIKDVTNSFIVIVGTHPSALPEQTLKMSKQIDAIARREYDYTIKDLANALEKGRDLKSVSGISYRKGENIIHNPDRPPIENLDEIPFVTSVYKKHLNVRDYFFSSAKYPMVMIMTGRGCPFRCFFCNWPQVFLGRKYRLRSPNNVVEEFEYVINNLPEVKEIGIEDDTFSADIKRVRKICELLIEKDINKEIEWWANTRVNLDFETMRLMKKAGCRLIIPGYESGVQKILNNAKKGITIEQSIKFTKDAKRAGLLVHGCFIFGLPGETKETIRKTLEFAKKLEIDDAQFFPLMPYPGTEAYEWAKKNGYLITENFSEWLTPEGYHKTVISLPELSNEEIVEECKRARKEFYLRPKYILYKLKQSLSDFDEAKRNLRAIKNFYRHLI